jgi:hypothetical protein
MGNQMRGTVSHEIGGERLELLLATNEWCDLEEELGKTTQEILTEFFAMAAKGDLNMRFMRSLFRAALSQARPSITLEQAGAIMSDIGLVATAPLLGKVILASMPRQEEAPPGKLKAPRRAGSPPPTRR